MKEVGPLKRTTPRPWGIVTIAPYGGSMMDIWDETRSLNGSTERNGNWTQSQLEQRASEMLGALAEFTMNVASDNYILQLLD